MVDSSISSVLINGTAFSEVNSSHRKQIAA